MEVRKSNGKCSRGENKIKDKRNWNIYVVLYIYVYVQIHIYIYKYADTWYNQELLPINIYIVNNNCAPFYRIDWHTHSE